MFSLLKEKSRVGGGGGMIADVKPSSFVKPLVFVKPRLWFRTLDVFNALLVINPLLLGRQLMSKQKRQK